MIKRTLILIASALGIVFIPYFLGMIGTFHFFEFPIYIRGLFYLIILLFGLAITVLICRSVYLYIRYGNYKSV